MEKQNNNITDKKQLLRLKYLSDKLDSMCEKEIIQLLLTYSAGKKYEKLSEELYERFGTFNALADADLRYLLNNSEIDEKTVVLLHLIPQLSRLYLMDNKKISVLNSSLCAKKYFENFFIGALEEQLVAVAVNEKFAIIEYKIIAKGSSSFINTSCRSIADFALKNNSFGIFIAHNHPYGSSQPSSSDYASTSTIVNFLNQLNILLIDHIIIGKSSSVSMRELPYTLSLKSNHCSGYSTDI